MDLNKVTLIGHMVRDPETKNVRSGQSLARFSLATNYAWQDSATKARRETVDYHDIVAWGKLGEIVAQYVKKGAKIYIEGRLRNRSFTARDGQKKTKPEVIAENMIMLGHRSPRQATVVKEEPEE